MTDGVCSANLARGQTSLQPTEIVATRSSNWAVAAARSSMVNVPAGATWQSYYASVTTSLPDNSSGKPLVNRPVWVVEVNGLNYPYGGQPHAPGDSPAPQLYLHHILDVWDDQTGTELFDVSCP
jgi:hypothetical protein